MVPFHNLEKIWMGSRWEKKNRYGKWSEKGKEIRTPFTSLSSLLPIVPIIFLKHLSMEAVVPSSKVTVCT